MGPTYKRQGIVLGSRGPKNNYNARRKVIADRCSILYTYTVHTETGIVTHGMTMRDIVRWTICMVKYVICIVKLTIYKYKICFIIYIILLFRWSSLLYAVYLTMHDTPNSIYGQTIYTTYQSLRYRPERSDSLRTRDRLQENCIITRHLVLLSSSPHEFEYCCLFLSVIILQ